MAAGFEFLATSAIFALVFVTWLIYESVQAWKRHSRKKVIRAPRRECVTDAAMSAWMGRR